MLRLFMEGEEVGRGAGCMGKLVCVRIFEFFFLEIAHTLYQMSNGLRPLNCRLMSYQLFGIFKPSNKWNAQ